MSEALPEKADDDLWEVLSSAEKVASRDLMAEAASTRQIRGFYFGLASQSVFRAADGRLILNEATFESDGAFMSKISCLDPAAQTAECWRGRAINNPNSEGVKWSVSGQPYEELLATIDGLMESHPVAG
ncbi:MAG TPA: hypothetical protein VHC21_03040 [Candidatus Saccharimonadales bacterium]|nr:hypothetical protein [Candidatus Saccharimonadales bacterium]